MNLEALRIGASVSTAFGAFGLAIVVALFAYYRHLRSIEVRLKEMPRGERGQAFDPFLTRYKLDAGGLTPEHTYDLIRMELEKRASRVTLLTVVVATVFVICFTTASILQRYSTNRIDDDLAQAKKSNLPPKQLTEVAAEIGLNAIEHGKYKTEENDRFTASIKIAKNIKILVVNGDNIFQTFKDEFREFLAKPESSMQVFRYSVPTSDHYF